MKKDLIYKKMTQKNNISKTNYENATWSFIRPF